MFLLSWMVDQEAVQLYYIFLFRSIFFCKPYGIWASWNPHFSFTRIL